MKKVLHILDHSLPEQSGYATRTQSILQSLQEHGYDVSGLTGPKHQNDISGARRFNDVNYFRTPNIGKQSTSGIKGQIFTVMATRKSISAYLATNKVDLIHAHSPCLNGLAALGKGIPLLYEMRSSWEDAAVSVGTTASGSIRYRLSRSLENIVLRKADAVAVICSGLRDELLARGIEEKKIIVVPNAVPERMFQVADAESLLAIRQKWKLGDSKVIGYFGSFFEWEGIDLLIKALPQVLHKIPGTVLVLAGGGHREESLRELCDALGLTDRIVFAGRVSSADIPAYYGIADVMAYPRKSDRLTEMVTPLKPLEAMAQRVAVIASNVGGHRELISDGVTGRLFEPDSVSTLAETLIATLNERDRTHSIVETALQWVREERRWPEVCRRYAPVYEKLSDNEAI